MDFRVKYKNESEENLIITLLNSLGYHEDINFRNKSITLGYICLFDDKTYIYGCNPNSLKLSKPIEDFITYLESNG